MIRHYLSWVDVFIQATVKRRREWVNSILDGIRSFNSKSGKPTPEGETFADTLMNRSEFELIGVCPNIMYIKADGAKEDLNAIYVHPFGSPTLLYKHKKTCALVIAGPGIRFNDSVVREISFNQYNEQVLGITG